MSKLGTINWKDVHPPDPVQLFDDRVALLRSEPQYAAGVGWWADVAEVLNAHDSDFSSPDCGPVERVSLEGARDLLAPGKAYVRARRSDGRQRADALMRELAGRRDPEPS